jgi:hypothetical protein
MRTLAIGNWRCNAEIATYSPESARTLIFVATSAEKDLISLSYFSCLG